MEKVEKLVYIEINPMSKERAEQMLSSNEKGQICDALISIGEYEDDWQWAQDKCLLFLHNDDYEISGCAALGLAYIARNHHELDLDKVMPALYSRINDPEAWFVNRLGDVFEDIEAALSDEKLNKFREHHTYYMVAGDPCPQEGWWACPKYKVSKQYFKKGEDLPDFGEEYPNFFWQWLVGENQNNRKNTQEERPPSIHGGATCSQEGWWMSPADRESRRYFKKDEVMPELKSDYGKTIWQWCDDQDSE